MLYKQHKKKSIGQKRRVKNKTKAQFSIRMQTFSSQNLCCISFTKALVLAMYRSKFVPLICEVLAKLTGTEGPGP